MVKFTHIIYSDNEGTRANKKAKVIKQYRTPTGVNRIQVESVTRIGKIDDWTYPDERFFKMFSEPMSKYEEEVHNLETLGYRNG